MQRRHDIDALRTLAFGLVMLYHVGMAYVAGWHWHLKSEYLLTWLQWPMRLLSLWRMDLVFLVSGVALALLLSRPGAAEAAPGRLARQRSLRLLVPLLFGMAVVVPWQPYAQGVANGLIDPGFGAFLLRYYGGGPWQRGAFDGWDFGVTWNHLWYLPYLWLYTMLVLAIAQAMGPLLRRMPALSLRSRFMALRGGGVLLGPVLPLALWSLLLWPRFPPTHDLIHDFWLHAVYLTMFVYGTWIAVDEGLWAEFTRLRWRALSWAVAAFALHLALRGAADAQLGAPRDLLRLAARLAADAYLWAAIVGVLGLAHRHLNRPWAWLGWARESVYPWYVLHQTLIIAALGLLMPLRLGPWLEPLAVLGLTVAGCWLLTDGLVRRVALLRPLFGLGPRRPAARPARSMPHPSTTGA